MLRQSTYATIVTYLCWIYSLIGNRPAISSVSTAEGHSHIPTIVWCVFITVILLDTWWWNPSNNFIMDPATTQLSIPYNIIDYMIALGNIPHYRTFAPVFVTIFSTIPTANVPSKDSDTGTPSHYFCSQLYSRGMERLWPSPEAMILCWLTPVLTQNSVVASPARSAVPPLAGIYLTHNVSSWGTMVEPDFHTSCIQWMGWGVPTRSVICPPSYSGPFRSTRTPVIQERGMVIETCPFG